MPVPAQGDRATAMALVSAILMALIHRTKTGEGSWVGTSLLGNGLWSCGVIAQAALVGAYLPHRPPPDRPRSALGNIYRTSDDRWLQLTIVREDKMWPPLCETIGRPELLDDPRFATVDERRKRSAELAAILSDGLRQPRLRALAQDAGRRTASPSASSAGRRTCRDDEQAVACGAVVDTAIPEMPRTLANPIRLGFAEQQIAHAGAGARPAQRRDPGRGRSDARRDRGARRSMRRRSDERACCRCAGWSCSTSARSSQRPRRRWCWPISAPT